LGFFDRFRTILYIQVSPNRLTIRHLQPGKPTIEFADVPLVAIAVHPQRGQQVMAIGSAVKTLRPALDPGTELIIENGFEHPRSVIGDVDLAEIVLRSGIKEVLKSRGRLWTSPDCLLQVLGDWEGGLTGPERQALKGLALQVGARCVFMIDQPHPLMDEEIWALCRPKS
jgi:rod shape-determining protein MreB and related proteins